MLRSGNSLLFGTQMKWALCKVSVPTNGNSNSTNNTNNNEEQKKEKENAKWRNRIECESQKLIFFSRHYLCYLLCAHSFVSFVFRFPFRRRFIRTPTGVNWFGVHENRIRIRPCVSSHQATTSNTTSLFIINLLVYDVYNVCEQLGLDKRVSILCAQCTHQFPFVITRRFISHNLRIHVKEEQKTKNNAAETHNAHSRRRRRQCACVHRSNQR